MILKTVARSGKMHGYEIADSIQHTSNDVLQVEEGSLYPALQRMLIVLRLQTDASSIGYTYGESRLLSLYQQTRSA